MKPLGALLAGLGLATLFIQTSTTDTQTVGFLLACAGVLLLLLR